MDDGLSVEDRSAALVEESAVFLATRAMRRAVIDAQVVVSVVAAGDVIDAAQVAFSARFREVDVEVEARELSAKSHDVTLIVTALELSDGDGADGAAAVLMDAQMTQTRAGLKNDLKDVVV